MHINTRKYVDDPKKIKLEDNCCFHLFLTPKNVSICRFDPLSLRSFLTSNVCRFQRWSRYLSLPTYVTSDVCPNIYHFQCMLLQTFVPIFITSNVCCFRRLSQYLSLPTYVASDVCPNIYHFQRILLQTFVPIFIPSNVCRFRHLSQYLSLPTYVASDVCPDIYHFQRMLLQTFVPIFITSNVGRFRRLSQYLSLPTYVSSDVCRFRRFIVSDVDLIFIRKRLFKKSSLHIVKNYLISASESDWSVFSRLVSPPWDYRQEPVEDNEPWPLPPPAAHFLWPTPYEFPAMCQINKFIQLFNNQALKLLKGFFKYCITSMPYAIMLYSNTQRSSLNTQYSFSYSQYCMYCDNRVFIYIYVARLPASKQSIQSI